MLVSLWKNITRQVVTSLGLRQSDSTSDSPRQSQSQDIGTPLWDFACAVQRLSSFPLGPQKDAFWDEVVHVSWQEITRVLLSLVFTSTAFDLTSKVLKFKTAELQSSLSTSFKRGKWHGTQASRI